ncbi:hypothetical protein [Halorubrum laminariae]|uniref:Uncharacterized protein n=1 Tax=Halorubrum laminariae TaxID=1433523 RepID=A0ABD6BZF8_9EURY|nr:hypothetical protein [Halorubrum laminariae]
MNPAKTEYTIAVEEEVVLEAFRNATSDGVNIRWVNIAPIHHRTTAPLDTKRATHEIIADMAALCEEWPEDETTLYWNLHIPDTDTLIDPLTSRSIRTPAVSHLQPPPAPIVTACQRWYDDDNEEIEGDSDGTLLKGFFIKTTIGQDGTVTDAELIAKYTEPSNSRAGLNSPPY